MRRTKIIATVGPASDSDDDARRADRGRRRHRPAQLLARHARVARGDVRAHPAGRRRAPGAHVAILQDLGGPKIRTGRLEGRPADSSSGRATRCASPPAISSASRAHLDDVRRARARRPARAIACCWPTARSSCASKRRTAPRFRRPSSRAASLGEHKGINAPGVELPASAITPKDVDDLRVRPLARRGHGGHQLRADAPPICAQARALHREARRRRRAARREARAPAGARASRRDSRGVRRRDGRARRSRARDAARTGAARAEGNHPPRPRRGRSRSSSPRRCSSR